MTATGFSSCSASSSRGTETRRSVALRPSAAAAAAATGSLFGRRSAADACVLALSPPQEVRACAGGGGGRERPCHPPLPPLGDALPRSPLGLSGGRPPSDRRGDSSLRGRGSEEGRSGREEGAARKGRREGERKERGSDTDGATADPAEAYDLEPLPCSWARSRVRGRAPLASTSLWHASPCDETLPPAVRMGPSWTQARRGGLSLSPWIHHHRVE